MSQKEESGQTTALEKVPKIAKIKELFLENSQLINSAAYAYLDVDRMLSVALTTISRSQLLLECSVPSLVRSIMDAAKLGLSLNPLTQEGFLVPFKNKGVYECQFMIGYKGLIKLAKRAKEIDDVDVEVVYEKDEFDYEKGLTQNLVHKPHKGSDRGEATHVYAILWMTSNRAKFSVMTVEEAYEHGYKFSKSKKYEKGKPPELTGPWKDNPIAMSMKTVLRQVMKYCVLDTIDQPLISATVHRDEQIEAGVYSDREPIAPVLSTEEDDPPAIDVKTGEVEGAGQNVTRQWADKLKETAKLRGITDEGILHICEGFEINSPYEATEDMKSALLEAVMNFEGEEVSDG